MPSLLTLLAHTHTHLLLNGACGHKAGHKAGLGLPIPPNPGHGLQVCSWVPVAVKQDLHEHENKLFHKVASTSSCSQCACILAPCAKQLGCCLPCLLVACAHCVLCARLRALPCPATACGLTAALLTQGQVGGEVEWQVNVG